MSAFAGCVKTDGLTRISSPLPKLGTLEFVLDTPKAISKSVAMFEATLAVAPRELLSLDSDCKRVPK